LAAFWQKIINTSEHFKNILQIDRVGMTKHCTWL